MRLKFVTAVIAATALAGVSAHAADRNVDVVNKTAGP